MESRDSSAPIVAYVAGPLADLIRELEKLPTIGPKTAARLAYYLLSASREDAAALADAIVGIKDRVRFCSRCFSLTESDPCSICSDPQRDGSTRGGHLSAGRVARSLKAILRIVARPRGGRS